MRILFILGSLTYGGAETFAMKLFNASKDTNLHIDFIVNQNGAYDKLVLEKGSKIYQVPAKSISISKCYKGIKKVVMEKSYDAVLKFSNNTLSFIDLMAVKRNSSATTLCRSMNSNTNDSIIKKVIFRIFRPVLRHYCDIMIAPSVLAGQYLFGAEAVKNNRVSILNNGLPLDSYRYNDTQRTLLRESFGVSDNTKLIGFVGRLVEQKNPYFLIRTFLEFYKREPNSKLVICGEGPLKSEVNELVTKLTLLDRVIFLSSRADANYLYSAFDQLWLPSLYEGMPNVIVEAQACGLPCVVADTVTEKCKITSLVEFCSLNEQKWINTSETAFFKTINRIDACALAQEQLKEKGYSIDDTLNCLLSLIK